MYALIAKPDLFNARFSYSTPLWRQNNILISKVADFLNTRDTLTTFMYLSAGANETDNIKGGLARLIKVLQEKTPTGFVWDANYTANADHQNNGRISTAIGIAKWGEYLRAKGRNFQNPIVRPVVEQED
jgi:predicted alpha/beta superfamily hydrolase